MTAIIDIHARQITVGSEADALKIIDSLKKGAKFDDLAKSRSLDPAAKQNGGDMGWGNLARMEPQLAELLKDLKKGQYSSKPMQTRVGWIVFKVDDIRDAKLPPKELAAKYRNQATGETWSGRGLQPKWLKAAIAGGASLNDFAV